VIKAAWLARYEFSPSEHKLQRIVLSCDPAGKSGIHNDYTAIAICGIEKNRIYILHISRGHWTVLQMRDRIEALAREWNVETVIIEDTSSGMGLIQILNRETSLNVIGRHPKDNKEIRMLRHEGRFEARNVLLPKEAPWLADLASEILAFPMGRFDDQVDALLLFLDWFQQRERWDTLATNDYSWISYWLKLMNG